MASKIKSLIKKTFSFLPDKPYLSLLFRIKLKRKMNWDDPKTFNEKLQWLKLYNRNPEYSRMVDKYEGKIFAAEILGEECIIPTLGVWDSFDDIDFDSLPDRFVLKCTHDSGSVIICRDKSKLDMKKTRKFFKKKLKDSLYYDGREWPYKNVKPRIIAEKLMEEAPGSETALVDYKFFCFNGKADCVMLCLDRETGDTKFYFFDKQWNLKRYNIRGKNAPEGFTVKKPELMDEMFQLAEKISTGIPFVRVDFYCIQNQVYFGEMTFFPDRGFDANLLKETDEHFGELLKLERK